MEINKPAVLAELTAAFARYETALVTNDVDLLTELFWASPHTIRYGGGENLHGAEEIAAFRQGRGTGDLDRDLARTVITTFGEDFGTASTLFRRRSTGKTGRQMQTWVRLDGDWRVVAAHVSILDFPFPETEPSP
ncbi:MAG TPA: oxalurate catabolism protein HpxZ [Acidisoma sp.]|uniref:oxalurate catabolism protein HpxZ n=1 Tax=Acidisoma sp. TaxID=1872115 RepID=UPI002BBF29D7|nr:oxalurate catabolism protein HpxZ [Acidisoma sp.]HTI02754.1 oxalurate catabolism protein HpxZ [Acidisoma sp.]